MARQPARYRGWSCRRSVYAGPGAPKHCTVGNYSLWMRLRRVVPLKMFAQRVEKLAQIGLLAAKPCIARLHGPPQLIIQVHYLKRQSREFLLGVAGRGRCSVTNPKATRFIGDFDKLEDFEPRGESCPHSCEQRVHEDCVLSLAALDRSQGLPRHGFDCVGHVGQLQTEVAPQVCEVRQNYLPFPRHVAPRRYSSAIRISSDASKHKSGLRPRANFAQLALCLAISATSGRGECVKNAWLRFSNDRDQLSENKVLSPIISGSAAVIM